MNVDLYERYGPYIMSDADGRALGAEVREALAGGDDVALDFHDVVSVLSAFLNPAVGELYADFDANELDRRVRAVNASDVHEASLTLVRENAKRYYRDPAYRAAHDAALDELFA